MNGRTHSLGVNKKRINYQGPLLRALRSDSAHTCGIFCVEFAVIYSVLQIALTTSFEIKKMTENFNEKQFLGPQRIYA